MLDSIKTIGKKFSVYALTGQVTDTTKNYETKISGGGGGGMVRNGYGFTSPVSVKSSTHIHDQIFLLDEEDKEHAIHLTNFNIDCRKGHRLTAIWAIKQNKKKGPYIAIVNNTLGTITFNKKKLFWMMTPNWILSVAAFGLIFLIISNFILQVVAIGAWVIYGISKSNQVRQEISSTFLTIEK